MWKVYRRRGDKNRSEMSEFQPCVSRVLFRESAAEKNVKSGGAPAEGGRAVVIAKRESLISGVLRYTSRINGSHKKTWCRSIQGEKGNDPRWGI